MKKITYSLLVTIPLLFTACVNKEEQSNVNLDSNYKEKLSYLKNKYVEKNEVKITKNEMLKEDKDVNKINDEIKKVEQEWNKKLNIRILKKSSILYSKKRSRNKSKNYLGVYNEHDDIYYDNNGKTSKEIKLNHNYMLR